ncbi:hypothetical protein BV25DRAFT_1990075 [Artomyces pyxidatus]|uniref:Uncharacterized protein n=1 Tax=Artomyces pyxidatus TaxID=48021 RepID=A0ACB8T643_9AGAM|nr:hypothetical protein BV25DRAFT_1990075 [Artomyces pyxidatus]
MSNVNTANTGSTGPGPGPGQTGSGIGSKIKGAAQIVHGIGESIRGQTLGAVESGEGKETHAGIATRGRNEVEQGWSKFEGRPLPARTGAGTGAPGAQDPIHGTGAGVQNATTAGTTGAPQVNQTGFTGAPGQGTSNARGGQVGNARANGNEFGADGAPHPAADAAAGAVAGGAGVAGVEHAKHRHDDRAQYGAAQNQGAGAYTGGQPGAAGGAGQAANNVPSGQVGNAQAYGNEFGSDGPRQAVSTGGVGASSTQQDMDGPRQAVSTGGVGASSTHQDTAQPGQQPHGTFPPWGDEQESRGGRKPLTGDAQRQQQQFDGQGVNQLYAQTGAGVPQKVQAERAFENRPGGGQQGGAQTVPGTTQQLQQGAANHGPGNAPHTSQAAAAQDSEIGLRGARQGPGGGGY